MSLYYEATKKNVQSCSFAGNGTVNPNPPSGVSSAGAAASSCVSNPGAVFTPTPVASTSRAGSTSKTASKSGAVFLFEGPHALIGLVMTVIVSLIGGFWTLA
jgi:hypothetical protein